MHLVHRDAVVPAYAREGDAGADKLYGGKGNDVVAAKLATSDNDSVINCGENTGDDDSAGLDAEDPPQSYCERVSREA